MLALLVFYCLFLSEDKNETWAAFTVHQTYPVYRAVGLLCLIPYLWSFDLHVWGRFRVNYVYVFEFNPRNRLTALQALELALNNSVVYLTNFSLYLLHGSMQLLHFVNKNVFPAALVVYLLVQLITPRFLLGKGRSKSGSAVRYVSMRVRGSIPGKPDILFFACCEGAPCSTC
jgi:hypothetical protein